MSLFRSASAVALCLICVTLYAATVPSTHGQSQTHPQAPPGKFLDLDGSKIYYEESGTGPEAVALIHDRIAHSAIWDGVWPAFCKQFHTIRYDRRGYGRSPVMTQPYFETEDLQALLHHLQIKRAMLIGSSHGGAIAINFTLEHPMQCSNWCWWAPSLTVMGSRTTFSGAQSRIRRPCRRAMSRA